MQLTQATGRSQLPLFQGAIVANPPGCALLDSPQSHWPDAPEYFSELALSGSPENCLLLLAPILRELGQQAGDRWLTLIDAPVQLTQGWLRTNRINRERIVLVQSRGSRSGLELACEALRLGRSHTVISWINALDYQARQSLAKTALQGDTQSLNIRLG